MECLVKTAVSKLISKILLIIAQWELKNGVHYKYIGQSQTINLIIGNEKNTRQSKSFHSDLDIKPDAKSGTRDLLYIHTNNQQSQNR